MSEQHDVIGQLEAAQVLAGIRWANQSAVRRALADHSEDAGYNPNTLGNNRFHLFRDRLDRVFSCGKYLVPEGSDGNVSLDVLHAELPKEDIHTMPVLAPGTVRSAPLNRSPGWAWQSWRWLLASCPYGHTHDLPWSQKSLTKQQVAQQIGPDAIQGTIFEELARHEVPDVWEMLVAARQLDMDTFVVAHSLDALTRQRELGFGRPQLNRGGGDAWVWCQDLLGVPPAGGGRRPSDGPLPAGPDEVEDAPVRLRRQKAEQGDAKEEAAE